MTAKTDSAILAEKLAARAKSTWYAQPELARLLQEAAEMLARQQEDLLAERRERRNAQMMSHAAAFMLGPKGKQVWELWAESGVQAVNVFWGPEAYKLSGEERAQVLLDFENAPRTLVTNVDSGATAPKEA